MNSNYDNNNPKNIIAMKKIIILLALIVSFCGIKAQELFPSYIEFREVHLTGKANYFRIKLLLTNLSQNLNGFEITIRKPSLAKWAIVDKSQQKYFTAKGCGNYILARWEGKSDEEREAELSEHCDILSSINNNGGLVVIEILTTGECRFFPVSEDQYNGNDDWFHIPVGEFAIDMSDCEDGEYEIVSSADSDCTFSYLGGPEGNQAWLYENSIQLTLYKRGDLVSVYSWFPLYDFDGIEELEKNKSVESVRYYNLAGVESAEPQPGVNLKVTTYSDGSRTTQKIVR